MTTPFGRRAMSLGMLANQQRAETIEPGITRNKWKLFRAVCEARPSLGVTDRALTVLDALLTFYPEDEISEARGLVVFPSNAQLSLRARGMTPATLRRHLAVLIDAGLILRKDSRTGNVTPVAAGRERSTKRSVSALRRFWRVLAKSRASPPRWLPIENCCGSPATGSPSAGVMSPS